MISHVLFPLLCQTDEDLETFESDPGEYLNRKINLYEEISAPDVAATNFLNTLSKARRKQTFTVLNFINEVVNRYEAAPDDQKNYREKEGALRMIGTLSAIILGKGSPIADQVEYFFVRHVFPEFRSRHGFLRARACDVLEKFSDLDFRDENVSSIYTIDVCGSNHLFRMSLLSTRISCNASTMPNCLYGLKQRWPYSL